MDKEIEAEVRRIVGRTLLDGLPVNLRGHKFSVDRALACGIGTVANPARVIVNPMNCNSCGAWSDRVKTDGERVFYDGPECPYPNGVPETVFELNVPSGIIVVANDLRTLFPCDEPKESINLTCGRRLLSLAYAEVGMAHASVGNSCPKVYKLDDQLWVAHDPPVACAWEVASIITDLWWYSMVDFEEFARRLGKKATRRGLRDDVCEYGATLVDVRPGLYRFMHPDRSDEAEILTVIERVGDALPVVDYAAIEAVKVISPSQYVQQHLRDWPTLYSDAAGVAGQLFFTSGNGVDWHPNGHPRTRLDADIAAGAQLDAGVEDGKHHFYIDSTTTPISWMAGLPDEIYSALKRERIALSPSFARFAFSALRNLIWWGPSTDYSSSHAPSNTAEAKEKRARGTLRRAGEIYWALAEQYPEAALAYPDFAEWMMSNAGSFEEYCSTVELE